MTQDKACWGKRECKLHSPIWSHVFTCSGQIVGETEHGQGSRKSLTTECNKILFFLYIYHLPAPCIICVWDWFRRNVVANICESWLVIKLLMLWQCWFRLPNVTSFLYQSGCGYTSKSIFVTVAYFGQGIFCQHKLPMQSWGYMECLCRYISQSVLYFGRLTPVALVRTRQCKRWRVCMFAGQQLLCVYADKSLGVMKSQALTVTFKFSTAVLLSPSVWCLGHDMDSPGTCLSSCGEKVGHHNGSILYFCFLPQHRSCPPFTFLLCNEGNSAVVIFISEKLLSEIKYCPYFKTEIII